ncbi:MAG: hypothetical protein GM44_4210 [actinobacterium acAMD-2]|nr:MAG: hypothetical protein GM44_4210 [actinobacterium acAMD-2]
MEFAKTKRGTLLVASLATALLVGGGVAFAYWTTTGSGTGSAAAGDSSPVDVTQTNTVTGLYPGGPAQDIDLNIDNSNDADQYLAKVTVSVSSTSNAGCTAADFTVTDATIGAEVPSGSTNAYAGSDTGASIKMNNAATSQDACKNATINLAFNAS